MKNTFRAWATGMACAAMLASATLGASAVPVEVTEAGPRSAALQVGAPTETSVAAVSAFNADRLAIEVTAWPTCLYDSEGDRWVGGVGVEAVNLTGIVQTLRVVISEFDRGTGHEDDWYIRNLLPEEQVRAGLAMIDDDGEYFGDGEAIRFWDASNPDRSWNVMFSLPDCANGDPFTDSDFFADQFGMEIDWMYQSGTSTGWLEEDGTRTYRGLTSMNRDAMAAFLYRMAGTPAFTPPATPSFKDVTTSNPYYKEIEWLRSRRITTGWSDGTFRPWTPVARDAMAAFLYRFSLDQGEPPLYPPDDYYWFDDVLPGTEHFDEIYWMAEMGLSHGWQVGPDSWEYRPRAEVKRDAIAAFMFRYTDLVEGP